jgi:uncharacterized protein YjbI with pentapeptide repeats
VPRQELRLTTRAKTVLWVAAILILLIIAANFAEWTGFQDRTPWNYLDVFLVPVAVAVATLWFTSTQEKIALDAEERRAQEEALQAYLDKMSELLIDKQIHLKSREYDETRLTARAHTLAILERLDADGKRTVLLFLREARLINRYDYAPPGKGQSVVYYAHYVGLRCADLSGANLKNVRLISGSRKEPVSLQGANLKGAKLSRSLLIEADLSEANLSGAILTDTDLSNATLNGAILSEARGITNEELDQQAASLEGATMPNGQKYEDWLKDREGRKEDRENDPPQPEADRSKPRRWQTVFSFLRDFTRQKEDYSPFFRLLVKVLLPTYVFGIFLVWTIASIGEYSAHHPEDGAAYLPPGAYLLVAWGFGIYAGSRDGSWEHFRWFFPCVALVMALGVTFWITYVSIVDQELPIDQLWMLTLRKILVRLKVFLSTYFVFIFGALFARALARLAEEPRIDDHSRSESDSSHRFQAWLAFVGTIITALASLLGDLVT